MPTKKQAPPPNAHTTPMYTNPAFGASLALDTDAYVADSSSTGHPNATYNLFLSSNPHESSSDPLPSSTPSDNHLASDPLNLIITSQRGKTPSWLLWPQRFPHLANAIILALIIATIVLALIPQGDDTNHQAPECDPNAIGAQNQAPTALTLLPSTDTTQTLSTTQTALISTARQSITSFLTTAAPTFFAHPPTASPSSRPSPVPTINPSNHPTAPPTIPIRADLDPNAMAWNGMTLVEQNTFCRSIYGGIGGTSCDGPRTDGSRCCEFGGCGGCEDPTFRPTNQPTNNPTDTTTGAPVAAGRADLNPDPAAWNALSLPQQNALCRSIYGGVGGTSECVASRADGSRCCEFGGCGGCEDPTFGGPTNQPTNNPTDTTTGAPVAAGRSDLGSDATAWNGMTVPEQIAHCTSFYPGLGSASYCVASRNDRSRCCDLGGCGGCPSP